MGIEELLNLPGIYILPAANYHILNTACYLTVALLIHCGQVAGMQPSFIINSSMGGFRQLVIAFHNIIAPGTEFALDTPGDFLPGLGVNNFHFYSRDIAPYSGHPQVNRVIGPGHGNGRS